MVLKSEDNKFRGLVVKYASTTQQEGRSTGDQRGLQWVFDSPEDFTMGDLKFDGYNYFVPVQDVFRNQVHSVNLPERDLRMGNFAIEMDAANRLYQQGLKETREKDYWRKTQRNQKMKRKVKQGLLVGLVASAISLTAFGIYKHVMSPEKVAARQRASLLDEKAALIIPLDSQDSDWFLIGGGEEYSLENGDKASVYIARNSNDPQHIKRIYIALNGEKKFISESWDNLPDGDARNLEFLEIKTSKGWTKVKEEKINDGDRREYEDIILKIAEAKSSQAIPKE